jgi:ribonuclease HII
MRAMRWERSGSLPAGPNVPEGVLVAPMIARSVIRVGIDEVGRGPLAGPVLAAAVWLPVPIEGLADSKTLTPAQREALTLLIRAKARWALGAASVREIDRLNILVASHLAMRRAMRRLALQLGEGPLEILVDGHLDPQLGWPCRCIVGGDGLVPEIGAASILAKVTRDRLLARLALRHPAYGFEHHAGYPTAIHRAALELHGATRHHRCSFEPVRRVLSARPAP